MQEKGFIMPKANKSQTGAGNSTATEESTVVISKAEFNSYRKALQAELNMVEQQEKYRKILRSYERKIADARLPKTSLSEKLLGKLSVSQTVGEYLPSKNEGKLLGTAAGIIGGWILSDHSIVVTAVAGYTGNKLGGYAAKKALELSATGQEI
jgi:hypothetical protein